MYWPSFGVHPPLSTCNPAHGVSLDSSVLLQSFSGSLIMFLSSYKEGRHLDGKIYKC